MTRRKVIPYAAVTAWTDSSSMDDAEPEPVTNNSNYGRELQDQEGHGHGPGLSLSISPPPPNQSTQIIHTGLLIPGRGKPMKDMTVIMQDGVISSVQPTSTVSPAWLSSLSPALTSTTKVPVLLPGLWDCHAHLLGCKTFNFSELITEATPALAGARIARSVHDILMSGFTSIRELAGYGLEVSRAIDEGTLVGPRIYSAGAAMSQTSGHCDIFDMPSGFVTALFGVRDTSANGFAPATGPLVLADGVDECRRAVRLLIRRGAQVIKVMASGGVLSIADDPMRQQFSMEELKVVVEEARRAGRVVAAHCHGKPGIMAALHAGCHTIEHGTFLDRECVALMKAQGAIYVPTRTIVKLGVDHPELMSPESYQKMLMTAKHHLAAYRLAVQSGVKIALGTDLGVSVPPTHPMAHGNSGGELTYAVTDGGMSPLQAIEAATAMGPETLGDLGFAPKSGRIEVGYDADLIALSSDPLKNMELFKNPKNITHVWKGGVLYKSPGSASGSGLF